MEWLAWIGKWRFATAPLVAREFVSRGQSAPVNAVQRRLRGLSELGLVKYERVLVELPRLYWLTRDGVRTAGLEDGTVVKPKLAEIRHDVTVIDVAHWLAHYRVKSHELVTEREIRRMEWATRGEAKPARYSLPLPDRAANQSAWPDLVSVSPQGKVWGHEVEASEKDHRRLVRLMLAYAASERYAGAIYYPTSDRLLVSVTRAADEANETAAARYGRRPITVTQWPVGEMTEED